VCPYACILTITVSSTIIFHIGLDIVINSGTYRLYSPLNARWMAGLYSLLKRHPVQEVRSACMTHTSYRIRCSCDTLCLICLFVIDFSQRFHCQIIQTVERKLTPIYHKTRHVILLRYVHLCWYILYFLGRITVQFTNEGKFFLFNTLMNV